ncbi:MAG: 30S ribosomal protein S17 [Candidatus Pacebacteria bacterium]|nr:30S ribosomal protein S17 [Candidatus Paceibacterota bacterium]
MEAKSTTGKTFEGIVVKSAMKDTVTVEVQRYEKHPKYKKYIRRTKKFLVHNPGNSVQVGDRVTIRETRPISKLKRFVIASRVAKPEETTESN